MNDHDALLGKSNIEFQAIGSERQAVVERRDRVLRGESGTSPVREDQRPAGVEERMGHAGKSLT